MDDKNDDLRKSVEAHKAKKGQIINLAEYANTTDTREMIDRVKEDYKSRNTRKRELKNKPSSIRWKAGIAAVIMLGSIIAAKSCNMEKENIEPITSYSDTTKTQEVENRIDTINEVSDDFEKQYLDAYNQKYGTNYTDADFITKNLRGTSIYQLADGRKVTRGNLPYETKEVLNKIGEYASIEMHSDIAQIVASNGKILGSYNIATGEFIYSGNQLEDLEEDFDVPTLESLGISPEKLKLASEVKLAKGVESKESIGQRIADYNAEGFEIGE